MQTLPDEVMPLGDRLAAEAERIPNLIGPNELVFFALYVLAAALLARLTAGAVHGLWRLGFDGERKLGRWLIFAKIALGTMVVYAVLREFVDAAPILSGAAIVLFGAVVLLGLRGNLENLAVGVDLAFRRRFRPGDRIVLQGHSGTVREIGLTGVHLRATDGTAIFLPNRLLNEAPVLVTRAENTSRVVVELRGAGELGAEQAERVRRTALLSPYRSLGSPIRVQSRQDGVLEVEIQVHSSLLVADAEAQLLDSVRVAVAGERS